MVVQRHQVQIKAPGAFELDLRLVLTPGCRSPVRSRLVFELGAGRVHTIN